MLTRLTGLSQATACGFSTNEPIASVMAGTWGAESAFSFVGMDDRRDGCVFEPFRIVEPPRAPQGLSFHTQADPPRVSLTWTQMSDFEPTRATILERDEGIEGEYWKFLDI